MTQPNIILIFPDQWRGDCLGADGHPVVRTPWVDTLALEGLRFTAAYTPAPTCVPARACLATGKSPSGCGRLGYKDGVPWRYENTLMHGLRDHGYQTINVGKTHFFPQKAHLGFEINRLYDPQRTVNPDFESDYHVWLRNETGGNIQDPAHEFSNNTWVPLPWTHDEYLHPTNWTTNTAIRELKNRDEERPFFLQLGYHRPHPPYDPPWPYFAQYQHRELPPVPIGDWAESLAERPADAWAGTSGSLPPDVQDDSRRAYYAAITHVDHQIGKFMYWLKQNKLYADTWIFFVSDHGEMLGDHHRRHKIVPHEGSARIPLVVKPPTDGEWPTGQTCETPVALHDLMPTLLETAGAPIPEGVEALSLARLLRDPSASLERSFLHGEHAPQWQFLTDGREKYIWNSVAGEEQFFDLRTDPQELRNLAASKEQTERVRPWRERLIEILSAPERKADGLSDGKRLIPGVRTPVVRDELLQ